METKEISLRQLFAILKRRIFVIILSTAIFAVAAYFYSNNYITPLYTASISMYVYSDPNRKDTSISSSELSAAVSLVNTYLVVLKSDSVLDQVVKQLQLSYSSGEIRSRLTTSAIEMTQAFTVSYTDSDPKVAQSIVNTIAKVAPGEIVRVVKAGGAEVIDYAKEPMSPTSPNTMRNSAICGVVGFVLSCGVYLLKLLLDTKIRSEEDLKYIADIPVLAIIPPLIEN